LASLPATGLAARDYRHVRAGLLYPVPRLSCGGIETEVTIGTGGDARPTGASRKTTARKRYGYPRRPWLLWHVIGAVSFVMERRMLHGIKACAEGRYAAAPCPGKDMLMVGCPG